MENVRFFSPELFKWVIIPLLIVLARIGDVSLGTIRIISIGRGYKFIAPLLGFLEILIWLLAIRQIMQNLTNIFYYIVYSGGFAAGTFVGMYIEEKLAIGILSIRIITRKDASELINFLRSANYGVTSIDAQGATGQVHVIYSIVKRSDVQDIVEIINRFNPRAFYLIEDVRFAREGIFPVNKLPSKKGYLNSLRLRRKGK
jgi:uncharacterized protein YebE (UPF0316 family)